MNIKNWFKKAGIRALWTMGETALGVIGGATLFTEVDWLLVANATITAGIISMVKSAIVGLPELEEDE